MDDCREGSGRKVEEEDVEEVYASAAGGAEGGHCAAVGGLCPGLELQTQDQAILAESNLEIIPTPLESLQQLLSKDEQDIIVTLLDESFGFGDMLNSCHISNNFISAVLALLAKAIKCNSCPQILLALLKDVLCSDLFTTHVPRYLTKPPDEGNEIKLDCVCEVIENLVNVSEQLLLRFPNKASEVLGIAFLTIRGVISRYEMSSMPVRKSVIDQLDTLEMLRAQNLSKHESSIRHKWAATEITHARLPPCDFRVMDILPNWSDIHGTVHPFIRANLVRGPYNDVNHYLDVHFRLMREDFVAPLRDGMAKYLALLNRGKRDEARRLKEIKIFNVRIVKMQVSLNEGLLHMFTLDVDKLKKISRELSESLMTGSLVCISPDDFQTFQLGIVAEHNDKLFTQGYVLIKLLGANNIRMPPDVMYTMAESPAYFEAYNHILRGFQTMKASSIPFKQYIIEASTNLGAPRYLFKHSVYDFASLTESPKVPRNCRVLATNDDDDQWPSAEELHLDVAQYSALKLCLTKEVAIVQGPPGTGKTFLGLKVVEILLKNRYVWGEERGHSPILIVCSTNHALDQFLEGILRFSPDGLVRIGSQSKSPNMDVHNLGFLRRQRHYLSMSVHDNDYQELNDELRTIEYKIGDQIDIVNQSANHILHHDVLKSIMLPAHYKQFEFELKFRVVCKSSCHSPAILTWLNWNGNQQEECLDNHLVEIDDDHPEEKKARRILASGKMRTKYDWRTLRISEFIAEERLRRLENRQNKFASIGLVDAGGFKLQGGNKKSKQVVEREMENTTKMTEAEANGVLNVFLLSSNERWRLYRYWVSELTQSCMDRVKDLLEDYERIQGELKELLRNQDLRLLRNARVIGVTTTGAAKNRDVLRLVAPKIVIIEEAAQVFEAHIITALSPECEHLILIGDQQQLRPIPMVYRLAHECNLDVSLFERLIGNGLPYERLQLQRRMRPRISRLLVPHIYKDLQDHPLVEAYPHVRGFVHDVFFVSHDHVETAVSGSTSHANDYEAQFLLDTCRHLLLQGYSPEKITMLTTYLAQVSLINQLKTNTIVKDVKCTVVDNFQGEENDIILLSLVRSNDDGKVGYIKTDNRVCVALSRAKIGLICIGNFEFFAHNARIWSGIVESMRADGLVGPKLKLCCDNHSDVITEVVMHKDFNAVPDGGCNLPCEYRFSCGHRCRKMCHIYDKEHREIKCREPCEKDLCEHGHKCKKLCSKECGLCWVPVDRVLPQCGHVAQFACHLVGETIICQQPCEKLLICGHRCLKRCGEQCNSDCGFKVNVTGLCGHVISAPCNLASKDDELQIMACCKHPCTEILPCDHICSGNCYDCRQGRMHLRCKEKCGRTLLCGHSCDHPCARNCPPCQKVCESRCEHSKCPMKCGFPCTPCKEPCVWRCEHQKCTRLCHETCDRPPCNEACPLMLNCGHPCIGFCGEPCPKQCRICDKDDVCEIFFGTEDKEDARFVLLADCGHIVESTGMDSFLGRTSDANVPIAIEMKRCPKCKMIIRRTLRYKTVVNRMLSDVTTIKRKYFDEARHQMKIVSKLHSTTQSRNMITRIGLEQKLSCILEVSINSLIRQMGKPSLPTSWPIVDVRNLLNMVTLTLVMAREYRLLNRSQRHSVVKTQLNGLETWLMCLDKQSSDKEMQDFIREFERIRTLSSFVRAVDCKTLNPEASECYDRAQLLLMDHFTVSVENETNCLIKEMMEKHPSGLEISQPEKLYILSAIGMSIGNWYKCPNGHVYDVGEWSEPMQVERCSECRATIRGEHHPFLGVNQPAYAQMDGW